MRTRAPFALLVGGIAAAVATALVWAGRPDGGEAAPGQAAPAPPAASEATGDPARFVERVVSDLVANRYERIWPELHPAHRRVASRWEYADCELASAIPSELEKLEVVRVFDRRLAVAGLAAPVTAKAVEVRLHLRDASVGGSFSMLHTVHAVPAGGRWTWILPPERYEVYRTDACAGAGPTA